MDKYQGAPHIYDKRTIPVHLKTSPGEGETAKKKTVDALVYIDFINTSRDEPKTEYVHRLNMGLQDGLQKGVPQSYIDKYVRPFIPAESQ